MTVTRGVSSLKSERPDVRAVERFVRVMEGETFERQMAAVEWCGRHFVREKERRMAALSAAVSTGPAVALETAAILTARRRMTAWALDRVIRVGVRMNRGILRAQTALERVLDSTETTAE
jgi:hypothetical protein